METRFDVLLQVVKTKGMSGVREEVSDSSLETLFTVSQKDKTVSIVLDAEGLLYEGEEPRPGADVFALRNGQRPGENMTRSIQNREHQKNSPVRSLDMTRVKAENACGVRKGVHAHPKCDEGALERSVLRLDACERPVICRRQRVEEGRDDPKRRRLSPHLLPRIGECVANHDVADVDAKFLSEARFQLRRRHFCFFDEVPRLATHPVSLQRL